MRKVFTKYHGREGDTGGDAFFISFPRVAAAAPITHDGLVHPRRDAAFPPNRPADSLNIVRIEKGCILRPTFMGRFVIPHIENIKPLQHRSPGNKRSNYNDLLSIIL